MTTEERLKQIESTLDDDPKLPPTPDDVAWLLDHIRDQEQQIRDLKTELG